MFTVTVSTPGHLPDAEPITCDDITEARQAIADEMERDWDAAYEQAVDRYREPGFDLAAERAKIDAEFVEAHSMINQVWANESLTCNGLVYEIHAE